MATVEDEHKSVSQSLEPKQDRVRKGALASNDKEAIMVDQLRETLEEVFTIANMSNDKLLRSRMDKEGFIKLDYVLEFPAIKQTLSTLVSIGDATNKALKRLLKQSIDASRHLQFEVEGIDRATMVRYVHSIERKTLIIRELSKQVSKKEILALFNEKPHSPYCGKVVNIKLDIGSNWFVTFANEEDCLKSFKYLTEHNIQLMGETLHVRVKSSASTHPLVGHGHGLPVENTAIASPNLPHHRHIDSQLVGVSDYVQSSPIIHNTRITPYGAVSYEQHAYDQLYKTGTTPPPLPETQALYQSMLQQQTMAQVQAQAQTQAFLAQAQAAQVQAAQAQAAQAASIHKMQMRQQEMQQKQQRQHQSGAAPGLGLGLAAGVGPAAVPLGGQVGGSQDSPQSRHRRREADFRGQHGSPPRGQHGQHGKHGQHRASGDALEDGSPARAPVTAGDTDTDGGAMDTPARGGAVTDTDSGGAGAAGAGTGTGTGAGGDARNQDFEQEPSCDYPSNNFAKYSQSDFLDVFRALKEANDLGIPQAMAGRDHRIVSEEVKQPVSLIPSQMRNGKAKGRGRSSRHGHTGSDDGGKDGGRVNGESDSAAEREDQENENLSLENGAGAGDGNEEDNGRDRNEEDYSQEDEYQGNANEYDSPRGSPARGGERSGDDRYYDRGGYYDRDDAYYHGGGGGGHHMSDLDLGPTHHDDDYYEEQRYDDREDEQGRRRYDERRYEDRRYGARGHDGRHYYDHDERYYDDNQQNGDGRYYDGNGESRRYRDGDEDYYYESSRRNRSRRGNKNRNRRYEDEEEDGYEYGYDYGYDSRSPKRQGSGSGSGQARAKQVGGKKGQGQASKRGQKQSQGGSGGGGRRRGRAQAQPKAQQAQGQAQHQGANNRKAKKKSGQKENGRNRKQYQPRNRYVEKNSVPSAKPAKPKANPKANQNGKPRARNAQSKKARFVYKPKQIATSKQSRDSIDGTQKDDVKT